MRQPRESDFHVNLPGVGDFRFGRRTYGDKAKIMVECSRFLKELTDDPDGVSPDLFGQVAIMAAYKVLCVECPPGWESLEDLDMSSDPDAERKIGQLFVLLNDKEDSFRPGAKQEGEASGA
jgi:hypothetical protein